MKKGVTTETVVKLIVFAAGLIILLTTLVPGIWDLLFSTADVGECSLEFILNNLGNTDAISGCEMNNVVVTPDMIYREAASSRAEYYDHLNKGLLKDTANMFNPSREGSEEMWAVNKIIGRELVGCMDKTLGGKFLERQDIGAKFSNDVVCVICSRIVVTPAALDIFAGTHFEFAGTVRPWSELWMDEVVNKRKKMTYASYVNQATQDAALSDEEKSMRKTLFDTYSATLNEPLAIMLVNIPVGGVIGGPEDIRWIDIFRYEDITTMEFPWAKPFSGGQLKCSTIIS